MFTAGAQNTLPLWIFGAIRLGQQLPEVNAVVSIVILLTIIPVVLAARLAGAGGDHHGRARPLAVLGDRQLPPARWRMFRRATAMMVFVGLCAPEVTKTEPSAT